MAPILAEGDEVLVAPRATCRPGDVVVARHPFRTDVHLVKVLETYDERGHARLVGVAPGESTDSRSFGAVPPDLLRGRVVSALPSPAR